MDDLGVPWLWKPPSLFVVFFFNGNVTSESHKSWCFPKGQDPSQVSMLDHDHWIPWVQRGTPMTPDTPKFQEISHVGGPLWISLDWSHLGTMKKLYDNWPLLMGLGSADDPDRKINSNSKLIETAQSARFRKCWNLCRIQKKYSLVALCFTHSTA